MTAEARKKLFVHSAIQGSLLTRFVIHWALFAALSCLLLIALQTFFAVSQPPEVRYQQVRLTLIAFALVSLVLIPAFSLDLIRLSNRFVGPIVRLQKYLQSIDPSEVKPLQVRKNDYWRDLVQDVNTAVDRLRRDTRQSTRKGAAVIELAATLPVFALILFATIETTTMIFLQQSLEIGAYQGARVALIPSSNSVRVNTAVNQVLANRDVQSAAISVIPTDYPTRPYGTNITVRVSAPCDANSPFSPWFYGGRTLTGEVTMMKEY